MKIDIDRPVHPVCVYRLSMGPLRVVPTTHLNLDITGRIGRTHARFYGSITFPDIGSIERFARTVRQLEIHPRLLSIVVGRTGTPANQKCEHEGGGFS